MSKRIGGPGWSIVPPEGWAVEETDDCLLVVPPSGSGALQFSSHGKDGGSITDKDLLELAEDHLANGAPRRSVQLGDFVGFEIAYDAEELTRREWYLRKRSTFLFATWECGVEASGREDERVEAALVTLLATGNRGKR